MRHITQPSFVSLILLYEVKGAHRFEQGVILRSCGAYSSIKILRPRLVEEEREGVSKRKDLEDLRKARYDPCSRVYLITFCGCRTYKSAPEHFAGDET